jgi:hypothetical protein
MHIQNPFGAKNIRCRWKTEDGEVTSVQSDAQFIELPDDCQEAMLEAIESGKSTAKAWSSRMWCKDRGVMDVQDFMQMRQVEEEKRQLAEEKKKEQARKQKEARERTIVKEESKRVVDEKPSKVFDDKVEKKL